MWRGLRMPPLLNGQFVHWRQITGRVLGGESLRMVHSLSLTEVRFMLRGSKTESAVKGKGWGEGESKATQFYTPPIKTLFHSLLSLDSIVPRLAVRWYNWKSCCSGSVECNLSFPTCSLSCHRSSAF